MAASGKEEKGGLNLPPRPNSSYKQSQSPESSKSNDTTLSVSAATVGTVSSDNTRNDQETPILVANVKDQDFQYQNVKVVSVAQEGNNPKTGKPLGKRPIVIFRARLSKRHSKSNDKSNDNNNDDFTAINNGFRYYGLDENCYHAGGPLSTGDIEEIDGKLCVKCPWHRYIIDLTTGDGLYYGYDPFTKKRTPLQTKGKRQRVHKITINDKNGNIYIILNKDKFGKIASDEYAREFNASTNETISFNFGKAAMGSNKNKSKNESKNGNNNNTNNNNNDGFKEPKPVFRNKNQQKGIHSNATAVFGKSNNDNMEVSIHNNNKKHYGDPILAANMKDNDLVNKGRKLVFIEQNEIVNPQNGQKLGKRPIVIFKVLKPNLISNNNNSNENTYNINNYSYHAMDEHCYHAGGSLSTGDIEDINGRQCVKCPLHGYIIDVKTGESLYKPFNPKTKNTMNDYQSNGKKQRIHKLKCDYQTGRLYICINYKKYGKMASDEYAKQFYKPLTNDFVKTNDNTEANSNDTEMTDNKENEDDNKLHALPTDFKPFKLIEKTNDTHDTRIFKFKLKSDKMTLGLPIGKHIKIKFFDEKTQKDVIRPYTPISDDWNDKGYFTLLIKVYENGVMSQYLDSLSISDSILVSGSHGEIEYEKGGMFQIENRFNNNFKIKGGIKYINMIAGGTGITPMYQIIKYILMQNENDDNTIINLLFSNHTQNDILLKKELQTLAKKHENRFKLHLTISQQQNDEKNKEKQDWNYEKGRIDVAMMKKYLTTKSNDVAEDEIMTLICGPPGLMEALTDVMLPQLGFDKSMILEF